MPTPYDIITDRILAHLEAGTVPWRRPWNIKAGCPKNLQSADSDEIGHPFRSKSDTCSD